MAGWIEMAEGVRRWTLASGTAMMQMIVEFETGAAVAEHSHPHEQVSHVVRGRVRFRVNGRGGDIHDVSAGQSIYFAPDVRHAAEALEPSAVVDTFSPPREDLLAQDAREDEG